MAQNTNKRTILITGCSDDTLGHHLSIAFSNLGWRVFASARNLQKATKVTSAGIEVIQLDILSSESISSAVTEISNRTNGSLDMLFNNAGQGYTMPVLDIPHDKLKDLFELNCISLISTTKAFLPLLRKSTHGGIVVNHTSGASLWPGAMPFGGAYNMTKGAAMQMTETLRHELGPFGIRVINLLSGGVKSKFYDAAATDPLPPDSIFNVAKEVVEFKMTGKEIMDQNSEPQGFAREVAAKLDKKNPPLWIWAAKNANVVWLSTFLPVGTTDFFVKSLTGLDVVEKALKEKEKEKTE